MFRLPSLTPKLTFHVMEQIPGVDLKVYFKAFGRTLHGRPRSSDPVIRDVSFASVQRTLCSLVNSVRFLQHARVVFNDLKLENVMVDPSYPDVVLIDYIDSNHTCSRLRCPKLRDYRVIRTYEDEYNKEPSFAEDVWRMGLMMMDALMLLFKDTFPGNYPSEQVKDAYDDHPSRYPSRLIERLVDTCIGIVEEHYGTSLAGHPPNMSNRQYSTFKDHMRRWRFTLLQMMDKNPSRRPVATELLTRPQYVFRACSSTHPTHSLTRQRCKAKEAMFNVREDLHRRLRARSAPSSSGTSRVP